jgi:hypothetical protein
VNYHQDLNEGGRNWAREVEKVASATMRPFPCAMSPLQAGFRSAALNRQDWTGAEILGKRHPAREAAAPSAPSLHDKP